MISNSGHYWATGIELNWHSDPGNERRPGWQGWNGVVKYFDDGFCDDVPSQGRISTQGELRTRYTVKVDDIATGLSAVVDVLLADAARLGIVFEYHTIPPTLYYTGDGEWKDYPAPDGWERLFAAECERIGWDSSMHTKKGGS